MSDTDKMRAEFEAYAEQRNWSIRKNHGSYYWAEAARAWHIWQAAYAAGRKAEREAIHLKNWDGVRLGTTLEGEQ